MQDVFVFFSLGGGEKLILDIVYFAYEICPPEEYCVKNRENSHM